MAVAAVVYMLVGVQHKARANPITRNHQSPSSFGKATYSYIACALRVLKFLTRLLQLTIFLGCYQSM